MQALENGLLRLAGGLICLAGVSAEPLAVPLEAPVPPSLAAQTLLSPEAHAAKGLAAARDFPGYSSLCHLDARIRNVNLPRLREPGSRPAASGGQRPARAAPPPMRVFDNLWFLGAPSVAAWLYGSEDGYLLIDTLNNAAEADRYVLGGMAALGLDPKAIRGILITHGHGDHYGGATFLSQTLGIDLMMTDADWRLVERLGAHPRFGPPPPRGLTVEDGQVLRFGRSELTVHVTPGHTPGTVSPIFRLYDEGRPHAAMLWGGTGFNFGPEVRHFLDYANSARKMRALSEASGVDVFLSGHPSRDGSAELMAALAGRAAGAPHPFVRGAAGHALFTVLEQCALAQAARFSPDAPTE